MNYERINANKIDIEKLKVLQQEHLDAYIKQGRPKELESDIFDLYLPIIGSAVKEISFLLNTMERKLISIDDLEQEASLAFIRALRLFDPNKEIKFSTYLVRSIQCNIITYMQRKYTGLGGTTHKTTKFKIISDEIQMEGGERLSILDLLNKDDNNVEDDVMKSSLRNIINDIINDDYIVGGRKNNLERNRKMLRLRIEGYTFRLIGAETGLSYERVRQLTNRQLERIKRKYGNQLKEYLECFK